MIQWLIVIFNKGVILQHFLVILEKMTASIHYLS